MQFNWLGKEIHLQGLRENIITEFSSSQLKRMHDTKSIAAFYHLALTIVPQSIYPDLSTLPPIIIPLIQQFNHLFHESQGLPPMHDYSHHICLLPNSAPVNVRPYRYPHFPKSEIEKLL